jgi:hypothetical protein
VVGAHYFSCFKDNLKYRSAFFTTTKIEAAGCLQKFLKEVTTAAHVTKVLLSDGGKEFNCEDGKKC